MEHIFHIHTYRCKHASDETDEEYVKVAVSLGAKKITFTDHAPFEGNPFRYRMDFVELNEYVSSLNSLKEKYRDIIEIEIGLEAEYLPKAENYYRELKESRGVKILILGQHFVQHRNGTFSFNDDNTAKNKYEYIDNMHAMIKGIKSGYFDVLAHPDRFFRRCKFWTKKMETLSKRLIKTAAKYHVPLEFNMSSYEDRGKRFWRKEFWQLVEDYNGRKPKLQVNTIIGLDAHSTRDLIRLAKMAEEYKNEK